MAALAAFRATVDQPGKALPDYQSVRQAAAFKSTKLVLTALQAISTLQL